MILLNGFINGKLYDNEQVDPEVLIELFGLPIDLESKKPRVVLTLSDKYIAPDRLNGGDRHSLGTYLRSAVNGEYEGRQINIQYAERRTRQSNGEYKYDPHLVPFIGRSAAYAATRKDPKDLEFLTFMLLHPKCKNSPLSGPEAKDKRYQLDDSVARAANKVQDIQAFMEVYNKILGMSEGELRTKLAGMGRTNVDTLEFVEVKAAIMEMMEASMENFLTKWENHSTTFDGLVWRAKSLGIVEMVAVGAGRIWRMTPKYSQLYLASDAPVKLADISPSQPDDQSLKGWMLADSGNLQLIQRIINDLDQEATLQEMGAFNETPVAEMPTPKAAKQTKDDGYPDNIKEFTTEQKVNYALEAKLIRDVDGVFYFFKEGKQDQKLIINDPDGGTPSEQLTAFFEDEGIERRTLTNKVRGLLINS